MSNHDPFNSEVVEKRRESKRDSQKYSEEADIKWLMSSKRGRRVAYRLLEQTGLYQSSFHHNSMTMAFNEGNRNFGLKFLGMVNEHCPELYHVMIKERNNDGN